MTDAKKRMYKKLFLHVLGLQFVRRCFKRLLWTMYHYANNVQKGR